MIKTDINLLIEILTMTQDELFDFLIEKLKAFYDEENMISNSEEDYLVCVGSKVALVAHLDTVFTSPPKKQYICFDKEKQMLMSPFGIGGDDRNGVFGILMLIEQCTLNSVELPTLIFTKDEEIGCAGANILINTFDKSLIDINCMIELDRRGFDDSVYYHCINNDFKEYVDSFGFIEQIGSYSDVSVLSELFEVPFVNLSIGYLNEHSEGEVIFYNAIIQTVTKVFDMLQDRFLYETKIPLICEPLSAFSLLSSSSNLEKFYAF